MRDKHTAMLYQWEGRPKFRVAYPVALQHLLAMFVSNLTPIIVIANAAEATPAQTALMIQCAMFVAGIATLLNNYPIKIGRFQIGAGMPIVMGTASTFIAPGVGVAAAAVASGHYNPIGLVIGGLMIASVAELVVGLFYKYIKRFFPPMVIGCVLVAIGLMLIPIGINNFAGGAPATNPEFGSIQNLALGFTVFLIGLMLQRFAKGLWKVSAILIAITVGYVIAMIMGILDLSGIRDVGWISVPIPWSLRPVFEWGAISSFLVIYFISGLSTIGYTSTIAMNGLGRPAKSKEISGAIVCDAVSSTFAAVFNCLPSTEFGQNAGMVAMTKIINRWCFALCAFTLIIAGLFPKIGVIFTNIPPAVLGGAILTVFAMILNNGIQMIALEGFSPRNLTVLGVTFGIGLGFGGNAAAFVGLTEIPWLGWLAFLMNDRIAFVAVIAILTNLLFPRNEEEKQKLKAAQGEE
ncbi:MAG: purine/pyrimidine permease [Lachnospiraceae bacterium]|nr:purine/pyrimidine permease [Lachnospiraceae bacterium]